MLAFKPKVLFNLICRNDETIIQDCLDSILSQEGIRPYLNISCLDSNDTTFFWAKSYCKSPSVYEPNQVVSEQITACRTPDEKSSLINGVITGRRVEAQYYVFMHCPGILTKNYSKKLITLINDEVMGGYTDVIDSGIKIYTHLNTDRCINIGPYLLLKSSISEQYNHEDMRSFLSAIVNIGILAHLPEFLAGNNWIKSLSQKKISLLC